MNNPVMTRKRLETLSSADLISLADRYGVDIPEDLNRRFIIAELLDIAREMREDDLADLTVTDGEPEEADMPLSYNESVISAVPCNPVWLYVYWDIGESDRTLLNAEAMQPALILRVAVIGDDKKVSSSESFDIPVGIADSDQYILLPASETKKNIRVELVLETFDEKPRLLAVSDQITLARPCPDFRESFLGELPPLFELSGFRELLRTHFLRHRQAFS